MNCLIVLNFEMQKKEKEFIDQLRCRTGNLCIIMGLVQREKNEL